MDYQTELNWLKGFEVRLAGQMELMGIGILVLFVLLVGFGAWQIYEHMQTQMLLDKIAKKLDAGEDEKKIGPPRV
ncbi:MAG TPA: hypothetical protein VFQ60_01840 [Patescibacteria group bacterium]|nr:hypothetical protein [Patescibacteria group bacterium]